MGTREPGIEQVSANLVRRGVGIEAGIWTAADARYLLKLADVPWMRLLLEPWERDPERANMMVDAIPGRPFGPQSASVQPEYRCVAQLGLKAFFIKGDNVRVRMISLLDTYFFESDFYDRRTAVASRGQK